HRERLRLFAHWPRIGHGHEWARRDVARIQADAARRLPWRIHHLFNLRARNEPRTRKTYLARDGFGNGQPRGAKYRRHCFRNCGPSSWTLLVAVLLRKTFAAPRETTTKFWRS